MRRIIVYMVFAAALACLPACQHQMCYLISFTLRMPDGTTRTQQYHYYGLESDLDTWIVTQGAFFQAKYGTDGAVLSHRIEEKEKQTEDDCRFD